MRGEPCERHAWRLGSFVLRTGVHKTSPRPRATEECSSNPGEPGPPNERSHITWPHAALAYNSDMKFRVVLEQDLESGDWAAWCPELPGCASAGVSREEAIAGIREAIALYLEPSPLELAQGVEIIEVAA